MPMTKKQQMDYVREEAADQGVPFEDAWALFELLGESEMYDGFITMLEDVASGYM